MKNILIIHGHWYNRGDEAAIRAMIDEIQKRIPDINISMQILAPDKDGTEPLIKQNVKILDNYFPRKRDVIEWLLMYLSCGKILWSTTGKEFISELKKADLVIHAPGGPSIGDSYIKDEWTYLRRLLLAKRLKKEYFFYAPSMGPFQNRIHNIFRKKILKDATGIVFREGISGTNFAGFLPDKEYKVTLDSAFQNKIDGKKEKKTLDDYVSLKEFLENHDKIIGLTITDLKWNNLYRGDLELEKRIYNTFDKFIDYLLNHGYNVIFIPQLFGERDDYSYMNLFSKPGTFIMQDTYDSYFQQYVISKLYAVVGMRYHSNIFSCKMSIPFVSVAYEHKMTGFMKKAKLEKYCLDVRDISIENLVDKFETMTDNYVSYQEYLRNMSDDLQKKSAETTDYLVDILTRK